MTRQDWVRKVILLELRKKLKSNDATKCDMHKAESVLKMRRINLCHVETQTDQLIPAKRSDQVIINEKKRKQKLPNSGYCRPCGSLCENQRKQRKRQVVRCCQRIEQVLNMSVMVMLIQIGRLFGPQSIKKRNRKVEYGTTSRDSPDRSIVKMGLNTVKSPVDPQLRIFR